MKWRNPHRSMLDEAIQMLEHADQLHRQFFQLEHQRTGSPTWEPPVDIFETERELVIIAALPGISAEQLVVTIDSPHVIIGGLRAMPIPREAALIRRLEIPYGRFERRIELPAGQYQLGQRVLEDGCLILRLNKIS